jgi:hypothetical protein
MVIFRSYSSFGTISWNRLIFFDNTAQFVSQRSPPDLGYPGLEEWPLQNGTEKRIKRYPLVLKDGIGTSPN